MELTFASANSSNISWFQTFANLLKNRETAKLCFAKVSYFKSTDLQPIMQNSYFIYAGNSFAIFYLMSLRWVKQEHVSERSILTSTG